MVIIDLNKYYPPFLLNIIDIKELNDVYSMEMRRLITKAKQVLDNFTLENCDIETIRQWEEILKITGTENEPIEMRRQRLYLQFTLFAPYTIETLKSKLNVIIGKDGYIIKINYNQQTYLIIVFQKDNVNQDTIKMIQSLILQMAPAHLDGNVVLGSVVDTNYNEYYGSVITQANIYNINFE